MAERRFPEPDTEPRLRLVLPAEPTFAAVVATAAEVLLAGLAGETEATVDPVRRAAAHILRPRPAGAVLTLDISRSSGRLTLAAPVDEVAGDELGGLADRADRVGSSVTLCWELPET